MIAKRLVVLKVHKVACLSLVVEPYGYNCLPLSDAVCLGLPLTASVGL